MSHPTLTDLPPELLNHITTYLPTASSLRKLGSTNKSLHAFVEKEAWATFTRTRFPSLYPQKLPSPPQDVARTLTTLSKAWDRRAFVARYIEPHGDIRLFPGDKRIQRWKRPRGQTIGFTPQLDCFEEVGSSWHERREVLAFGAGAEICVRERRSERGREQDVSWLTYRPLSAVEGKDDVTSLHLLRPEDGEAKEQGIEVITGTANADLQLLNLSGEDGGNVPITSFTTQGQPVRSSSLLQQPFHPSLLAANLGDTRINLYEIDNTSAKIAPISHLDIRPPTNGHRTYRAWSTSFLSPTTLAIGLGPSEEPIHIYTLTPSGLNDSSLRSFRLQNSTSHTNKLDVAPEPKSPTSSVYPIVPLPSSGSTVFLSGAYDSTIRLHDLRSPRSIEQTYSDPTDDSAIYSLLPRGRETVIAGTSRHSLLKVFDLRLGSKAYSYLDTATPPITHTPSTDNAPPQSKRGVNGTGWLGDWNLFLKPHTATYPGRGGGNNWARRSAESSVYSLSSPSPSSPYIYAGVENAVLELAFTSVLDAHPDPLLLGNPQRSREQARRNDKHTENNNHHGNNFAAGGLVAGMKSKEILDLAMYDQSPDMKLMTQRSVWSVAQEVAASKRGGGGGFVELEGMDGRWRVGGS